jgi:hypothetical protein
LQIPSASVRTLDLLSKDEIVEIVKGAGIGGPRGLIQEVGFPRLSGHYLKGG